MVALGMLLLGLSIVQTGSAAIYDLLLKGGHVIDARNGVSAVRDVAIKDGRIAAVSPGIDPAAALKTVDVSGLYVTPGLIDIHFHAYAGGTYPRGVAPDGFTFRTGTTTVVDPGSAGWRTFDDFKTRIIDVSRTRVLAMLNIVGYGIAGAARENDLTDMEVEPTVAMATSSRTTPNTPAISRKLLRTNLTAPRIPFFTLTSSTAMTICVRR